MEELLTFKEAKEETKMVASKKKLEIQGTV